MNPQPSKNPIPRIFALIAALAAFGAQPLHAEQAPEPISPEATLLANLYTAESGSARPDSDHLRRQVLEIVDQYEQIAPESGRAERLAAALADSGLYSEGTTRSIVQGLNDFAESHPLSGYATPDAFQGAAIQEMAEILTRYPVSGLQFSGCTKKRALKYGGITGLSVGFGLLLYAYKNTTAVKTGWAEAAWPVLLGGLFLWIISPQNGPITC